MEKGIWLEIEELYKEFQQLGISQSVDYEKYYLYSLITHSTAIEGSTLTEMDAQLLFDEGVTAKGKPLVYHLMNEDLKKAYELASKELLKANQIGDTENSAKVGVGAVDKPVSLTNGTGTFQIQTGSAKVANSLSFSLHVGADADMTNKIQVNIDAMDSASLGIKGLNVKDDSGNAATYAVDAISDAISKVSSQRSSLGAVQNRLEHTINNLDNVVENTTTAESRIRDTDMAEEMVNYSKNNILAQAGQSMLAQANQSNQGVLSLLQ